MPQISNVQAGYSTNEIANYAEVSFQAVSKKLKKFGEQFYITEMPNPTGTGRKIKYYKPEVVSLWKHGDELKRLLEKFEIEAKRKMRADKGKRRNGDEQEWRILIYNCKERFFGNAQGNLKQSCEYAIKDYVRDQKGKIPKISADQLYRYLRMDGTDSHGGTKSECYSEGWKAKRQLLLKKSDHALINDHKIRYNYLEMFENEGLAGKGFGALKVIVIDDFKRDAFSIDDDDKLSMPLGVAFMDGLTGFPLHVQICKSITTNAIATGILAVVSKYGIHSDTVFVMENSRAMKNLNITQLVRCLYTNEQLEDFDNGRHQWIKELFNYQNGPIIHNLPNLPTYPFKASIERNFRMWKDEYDNVFHPLNYQGGNRNEATQMTLGSMPIVIGQTSNDMPIGTYTLDVDEYWVSFFQWLYSDFVNKSRSHKYKWWKSKTGTSALDVTIWNVFNYYLSDKERQVFEPNLSQVAYLLYFANPELQKRPVTIKQLGGYSLEINGKAINIGAKEIDETRRGTKVVTIPIPTMPNQYVVMDVNMPNEPQFICIGKDYTARRISDVPQMRAEKSAIRKERNIRMKADATMNIVNSNYTEIRTLPKADEMIELMLDNNNRIQLGEPLDSKSKTEENSSGRIDHFETAIESAIIIDDDVPDFIKKLRNKHF